MRLLVLLVVAGCVEPDPVEPQVTSGVVTKHIPMVSVRHLDVLLVIDNSPAMVEHQERLQENLRRFATTLRTIEGGLPSLRLGVTTTDLGGDGCTARGDDGVLRGDPSVIGNFVVDYVGPDGARLRNYQGDLADVLVRLADVGTAGCAQTQPLAAARRALENHANRSFLRETSFLAVVIVSARDAPDEPAALDDHARFFRTLHDDGSRVVFAGALGELAETAVIPQFFARFPHRTARASIAADDWTDAFAPLFGSLVKVTLGSPCLDGPLLDVDAASAGMQYGCAVWLDYPAGGRVIPACETTLAGPCWRIDIDAQSCPIGGGELFRLVQPPELPDRAMLSIECLSR